MGIDGFKENSYLINDLAGMADFGSSAYFINLKWLRLADKEIAYNNGKLDADYNI